MKYLLALVFLFSTVNANPAHTYLTKALEHLENGSVNRKAIDWDSLKSEVYKKASGALVPKDTYDAIRLAISLLGDNHSFFLEPDQMTHLETKKIQFKAELIDHEIGYLLVPPCSSISESSMREFALSLRKQIQELNTGKWIIDLRGNTGGNMWPMVLGLRPLIEGETFGFFSDGSGEYHSWNFHGAGVRINDFEVLSLDGPPFELKEPKVAVLVDKETCSSGEATAIAFIGGKRTRLFGQKTGGFTSANEQITLSDGAIIMLATTYMADRFGNIYREEITPEQVSKTDSTLDEAIQWLKS